MKSPRLLFKLVAPCALALGVFLVMAAYLALAGGVVTNCSDAGLTAALSGGGTVTFNCPSPPTTILVSSVKTINQDTLIDGGDQITLTSNLLNPLFNVSMRRQRPAGRLTGPQPVHGQQLRAERNR